MRLDRRGAAAVSGAPARAVEPRTCAPSSAPTRARGRPAGVRRLRAGRHGALRFAARRTATAAPIRRASTAAASRSTSSRSTASRCRAKCASSSSRARRSSPSELAPGDLRVLHDDRARRVARRRSPSAATSSSTRRARPASCASSASSASYWSPRFVGARRVGCTGVVTLRTGLTRRGTAPFLHQLAADVVVA